MSRIAGIILLSMLICSCSLFPSNPEENRQAVCKELKHRIIFNGATSNQTLAVQQRAETDTLSKGYKEHGC